jgi:hypothetical protein
VSNDIQRKIRCLAAFIDERYVSKSLELKEIEKDNDSWVRVHRIKAEVAVFNDIRKEMVHLGLIEVVKDE